MGRPVLSGMLLARGAVPSGRWRLARRGLGHFRDSLVDAVSFVTDNWEEDPQCMGWSFGRCRGAPARTSDEMKWSGAANRGQSLDIPAWLVEAYEIVPESLWDQGLAPFLSRGSGIQGSSRWTFPQPFAVIGRDPRVDVHLEDQQVSRRHVYLQAVAGWLFSVNLESRVGTRTEAGPQKLGWMMGDDFLCVGPYKIRRSGPTQAGDAASSRPPRELPSVAMSYGRDPLPEVTLEFLNGRSKATRWPMHRVLSDDRFGQRLQVSAAGSERRGVPRQLAEHADRALGRRLAWGSKDQRQRRARACQRACRWRRAGCREISDPRSDPRTRRGI